MPKLQTRVETVTTEEVTLTVNQAQKLRSELRAYADLKEQLDAITVAMNEHKANVRKIRERVGTNSLAFEGFKSSWVTPTRRTLDEKKILKYISIAELNECRPPKPTKPYEKITCPGEKDGEE